MTRRRCDLRSCRGVRRTACDCPALSTQSARATGDGDRSHAGAVTQHQWPAQRPPHELGAIAHGPLILAHATGISAGLRCVFAHPQGLHLPLAFRAQGVRIHDATAWSYGKLRRYPSGSFVARQGTFRTQADEADSTPYSEPRVVVEVNGISGLATTTGALHASDDDHVWARDADYWIDELPHDALLRITLSWPQAGLSETRSDLTLTGLSDLDSEVLPLL